MAKKKRITRKQLLKEPDEFLTLSAKTIQFMANNRNLVVGVGIGVVVAALAVAGLQYYSQASERKAYAMFEQGRRRYLAEVIGRTSPVLSLDETAEPFEQVLKNYQSTDAAPLSLMAYADLSYHRGDYQRAIDLYKRAPRVFSEDGAVLKLIWNGLAYAYEAQDNFALAAEHYQKITDTQDEFMKGDAYYNFARMKEAMNDQEQAIEAYKKVVKAYPNSAGFQIAREKVLRHEGVSGASD
jgi:tetratricopeptide (TPR) repeat protein